MVPATRAAQNIETTAESLQGDLARLEIQKHALERELAAVVAHLDSVQRALGAMEVLMAGTAHASTPAVERTAESVAAPADPQGSVRARRRSGTPKQAKKPGETEKPGRPAARAEADEERLYGRLTEQILEYFAQAGDVDVRARDVAAALGRDTDSGSINAVRSTLDRLVGASRIGRAGRGLYRAK
jgi:hypothetical protein